MRIRYEQLNTTLAKTNATVFIVSGDEPFQRLEAQDRIRESLKGRGYDERQVFSVEPQFDWSEAFSGEENLSLFGGRKLTEIRLPSGKPGPEGARVLASYTPGENRALLLELPRLSKAQQNVSWLKKLEEKAVFVQVWPMSDSEFSRWLDDRAKRRGLRLSRDALAALKLRSEGNLLAAAQEIEMLHLSQGEGACDLDVVLKQTGDSSRFELDHLLVAVLLGDLGRAVRILNGLRAEGQAPILINWALARMTRELLVRDSARAMGYRGKDYQQALAYAHRTHSSVHWWRMLAQWARIDRINKGAETGRVWDELLESLLVACKAKPIIRN